MNPSFLKKKKTVMVTSTDTEANKDEKNLDYYFFLREYAFFVIIWCNEVPLNVTCYMTPDQIKVGRAFHLNVGACISMDVI